MAMSDINMGWKDKARGWLDYRGLIDSLTPERLDWIAKLMSLAVAAAGALHLAHTLLTPAAIHPARNWGTMIMIVGLFFWGESKRRRGNQAGAVATLSYAVVGVLCFATMFSAGGLRSSEMVYFPIVMSLSGWLLGGRHALRIWALTTMTLLIVLAMNPAPASFGGADPTKLGLSPHWLYWLVQQIGMTLAAALSIAIGKAHAEALRAARKAALSDALTDMPNRRAYEERLETERERARLLAEPLSMIVLDVDGFKSVNDKRGHLAGDLLLAELGKMFARRQRAGDFCARLGGDEFAWIVRADEAGALNLARDLAQEARQLRVTPPDAGDPIQATLSLGVAQLRAGETGESLYTRADEALYQAKRAGKNQAWGETLHAIGEAASGSAPR